MEPLRWVGGLDGYLRILDQTQLPTRVHYVACQSVECVWEAIRHLRVRVLRPSGLLPLMGFALLAAGNPARQQSLWIRSALRPVTWPGARPTAVNLFWALQRMESVAEKLGQIFHRKDFGLRLLAEALTIHAEDRRMCEAIGR